MVSTSTTEAEYLSLSEASKQAIWMGNLLQELSSEIFPIELRSDNKGAVDLSYTTLHHKRSKHIDIRHHFIKECVEQKKIDVVLCKSEENLADFLTKLVGKEIFCSASQGIGMVKEEK